jgi:two-component system chemotaxis response regulator CheY
MTSIAHIDTKILVIEDEVFIRRTIARLLRSLLHQDVREASDGADALAILDTKYCPDLIFCDIRMAPMDGPAFLKILRSSEDRIRAATPVIMLSAEADLQTVRECKLLGISSYLLKPMSAKQLGEHVNAALRGA